MPYIHLPRQKRLPPLGLVEFLGSRRRNCPPGHEKRLGSDHSGITVRGNEVLRSCGGKRRRGRSPSPTPPFTASSYPDAVTLLLGGLAASACSPIEKQAEVEKKQFGLPPANHTMRRVYAYLLKSGTSSGDVERFNSSTPGLSTKMKNDLTCSSGRMNTALHYNIMPTSLAHHNTSQNLPHQ